MQYLIPDLTATNWITLLRPFSLYEEIGRFIVIFDWINYF